MATATPGVVFTNHQQTRIVVPEPQAQASHIHVSDGFDVAAYHGHSDDGKGSANGAELASLAHSSALQATNAVQKQHTAGSQAAFGIKSSLASAAAGVRFFITNLG